MFSCSDTAWVLAFGLMILNTDMYNRNIRVRDDCGGSWRMTSDTYFHLLLYTVLSNRCQAVGRFVRAACQTDAFLRVDSISQSVRRCL